ncbi:MAG: Flp pilus assembly complex ATPase component TadA [Candidatus Aenigmarchaeota archaeon]|nr:Flp pilus assembly complex ATPase component TadA [Candidatus Aenigmarchaeota archaeon]
MEINKKIIVPDTSVLINRKLSELIKSKELDGSRIIIPRFVIDELQAQASRGKDVGFRGLEEVKSLRESAKKNDISVSLDGRRPSLEEINLAKKGRIDALIRDFAVKENATLLTSDYVQALVGEAEGISVWYIPSDVSEDPVRIENFFDKDTQSVHLKVGVRPYAKKGKPGQVKLVHLSDKKIEEDDLNGMVYEILAKTHKDPNSFIEIGRKSAMVVQMGPYRIAITRPPFSSAQEVTAVRPIVKLDLKDYKLHEELEEMIISGTKGVLIAGPPGSGKSTFAASVAEFLSNHGKIVKTFEQPRDLQVGPEITQYAPLEDDWEKTSELLLLVRPDYTIFDEIRKNKDFKVFADMRLAGVGMIGVVHSTEPVSAIQRFIGRLELGIIPHVLNNVIFIKNGNIEKTYSVSMLVRVPSGMKDDDLARPVVEIRDFESKKLEYEIYTFGEENVVIPVSEEAQSPLKKIVTEAIRQKLSHWDSSMEVDVLSDNRVAIKVSKDVIPRIIGKQGKTIEEIEKRLGIKVSVEPRERTLKNEINYRCNESGAFFNIRVDRRLSNTSVDLYDRSDFLFTVNVGKSGELRVKKRSEHGHMVLKALAKKTLRIMG